ncbi:MAG: MFS transporter, partial [Planctomycetota bacterium]
LYLLGIMSNSVLGFYVHTYYIYDADLAQGAILGGYHGTVSLVFSFVGAFIVQLVSGRIDKKPLLLICVLLMLGSAVLMSVTYLPGRPYLTLATRPIQSIAETGFWILVISMRADVGDWDEYVNGRRREGMIAALGNWMVKLAITLSAIIGGVLLQYLVGFDAELAGDQNPGTLDRLKWTYVVVQASCIATVFGVLTLYPLSRGKLSDVRAELEQRREAV